MWRHSCDKHGGDGPELAMDVTGAFHNNAILLEITEAVMFSKATDTDPINSKTEWNYDRFQGLLFYSK